MVLPTSLWSTIRTKRRLKTPTSTPIPNYGAIRRSRKSRLLMRCLTRARSRLSSNWSRKKPSKASRHWKRPPKGRSSCTSTARRILFSAVILWSFTIILTKKNNGNSAGSKKYTIQRSTRTPSGSTRKRAIGKHRSSTFSIWVTRTCTATPATLRRSLSASTYSCSELSARQRNLHSSSKDTILAPRIK